MQQIEREQQIKVQEAEIQRREKELIATVLKQAEVERQRIAVLADAEKGRLTDRSGRACRGDARRKAKPKRKSSSGRAMLKRVR